MPKPDLAPDGEALPEPELTVDLALAACNGDARLAIEGLISDIKTLKRELALTRPAVSRGFSRGWHHRQDRPP